MNTSNSNPPPVTPGGKKPGNGKTVLKFGYRPRNPLLRGPAHFGRILPTLAFVIPITLLIWIWAERDQEVTKRDLTFDILLDQSNSQRVLKLENMPGPEQKITIDLIGPNAGVERAIYKINHGMPPGLLIRFSRDLKIGQKTPQNTLDLIRDLADFRDNGVTVTNARPPVLTVDVDSLVEVEVPVQLKADRPNYKAEFTPSRVTLRGPKKLLDSNASNAIRVYPDLLEQYSVGLHTLTNIALKTDPPETSVAVVPGVVAVSLDVKPADVKEKIDVIPIHVSGSPSTLDKYQVIFKDAPLLKNVYVLGPEAVVKEMNNKDIESKKKAVLEVDPQFDVSETFRSKTLKFILPPGVTVAKEDENREVEFRLVARGSSSN